MRVLLTNDDGIHAPGLQALEQAVVQLGWQPVIVAPAQEQSQCGHRVTTHQPLKVEAHGSSWIAELLRETLAQNQPQRAFWNINLPHLPPGSAPLPPRILCQPAHSPLNVAYKLDEQGYAYSASYASRPRDPGSDVEACFSGNVAVSLLCV
jgi:broad specificity polyphosphatase/5'/3'-nucleotidase SurE